MRDLMSKTKVAHSTGDGSTVNNADSGSGKVDSRKMRILSFLNDDISGAILDISFQRLVKREKAPGTQGPLELWSDDFEGKGDFSQYRSRLVCFTWIIGLEVFNFLHLTLISF